MTRQRIYIETLEQVLSNSTKVLLDSQGGGNMIYLPLDRLMERNPRQQQNVLPPTSNPMQTGNPNTLASDRR